MFKNEMNEMKSDMAERSTYFSGILNVDLLGQTERESMEVQPTAE